MNGWVNPRLPDRHVGMLKHTAIALNTYLAIQLWMISTCYSYTKVIISIATYS